MKGSINKQVGLIIKHLNAIGVSKKETRANSSIKGQNNHKVSNKIHSIKYLEDAKTTYKQLGNFIQERIDSKINFETITNDDIKSFINSKIEKGLTYKSISTQISHLEKLKISLESISKSKNSSYKAFNKNTLINVRKEAKSKTLKTAHRNKAFNNPRKVISNLKGDSKLVAQLQYLSGLRVREASNLNSSNLKGNNIIEIRGKGGYKIEKELSSSIYEKIESIINQKGVFDVPYSTYYKDLKEASSLSNERNISTHSFRYSYAQENYEHYRQLGLSHKEACLQVSEDLGHHRGDVVQQVYLK